ncbi:MAG: hypothetical protein P1U34_03110 [Coxiellaceae bacterium]|nr:hypothetical protein [Coxiellaceae bacterium]
MVVEVDMAVMGAGSGGLILAKALAKKGFSVALVEKREAYLRGQVLNTYVPFLKDRVWRGCEIPLPKSEKQIKEIERLAMDMVTTGKDRHPDRRVVAKGKIRLYRPYEVTAVDRVVNSARLRPVKGGEDVTLRYRHIFCCAGAKRPVLNLIDAQPLVYTPMPLQMPEKNVGVMQLQFPERFRDKPELFKDADEPWSLLKSLRYFSTLKDPDSGVALKAWDRLYLPAVHMKRHEHMTKATLVCSLPDVVIHERDAARKQRLLLAWGRKLAYWRYRQYPRLDLMPEDITAMKPSKKYGARKDALRGLTTQLLFDYANRASFKLNDTSDGYCVVVGDAYAAIPYIVGEGSALAMWQALMVTENINEAGEFDAPAYQRALDELMTPTWRSCDKVVLKEQDSCLSQMKHLCEASEGVGITASSKLVVQRAMVLVDFFENCQALIASPARDLCFQAMQGMMQLTNHVKHKKMVVSGLEDLLLTFKQLLTESESEVVPIAFRVKFCRTMVVKLDVAVHTLALANKSTILAPARPLHTSAEVEVWRQAGFRLDADEVPVLIDTPSASPML